MAEKYARSSFTTAQRNVSTDSLVDFCVKMDGQLAELRLLMAQFQEMMAAHQRPGVPVQAVDRPQPTATPAAAAELPPIFTYTSAQKGGGGYLRPRLSKPLQWIKKAGAELLRFFNRYFGLYDRRLRS